MDMMPINTTRVQDRDRSQEEDSSMGTLTKKGRFAEGEANKRKRRRRRKIMMEDFPLGKGIKPYDLIEDISTQKPNITWPQLVQLSSKTRREWSKLVSTRRTKNKEINLIRANASDDVVPTMDAYVKGRRISNVYMDVRADKKWGFGLLVLKPNGKTKPITYDLKDQKKEDHRYETKVDEESSFYDSHSRNGGKEDDLQQLQSEESMREVDLQKVLVEDLTLEERTSNSLRIGTK
ncbi:hypothetical protein KP509_26G063100 [Ceratopteris richardii]|uniref:Uncharacterized protein n=1 Tax=Ceratopteris richardii TaxID=49495 RepID=A0A8T2RNX0_CERRI|nr:hypothetical protein KP509_26G063100 [Ceratopteris richardii]